MPIFSLTYGYMAIINIDLITYNIHLQKDQDEEVEKLSIWDSNVAGPSYVFLFASIFVFSFLVYLFEAKFFQQIYNFICFCRFSRKPKVAD